MNSIQDELSLLERLQAPTPSLFKTIRNVALIAAALATALIQIKAQGIELPTVVDFVANKIVVVSGAVATLIAQLTVDYNAFGKKEA